MNRLTIRRFAHVEEVHVEFGDLTVLVGAQGTGKSLVLQWLKVALDGKQIVGALRDAGQETDNPDVLIDLIFGVGMGSAWRKGESEVELNDKPITPTSIARLGDGHARVFFIPAHRAMLISDGWAAPFQKLTSETPVVARLFSQNLFDRFTRRSGDKLFPLDRVLKGVYRRSIDDAVFHGGTVGVETDTQHRKRLKLTHGGAQLPFMTWTAGQREFTPLLLGLYELLPSRKKSKVESIDWVVVEEPEMGLHPSAIRAFMLLVLDLLWRGYRVVVSTHSPLVLTAVWMLRRLSKEGATPTRVCEGFGVEPGQAMRQVAASSLEKDYRTHLLAFEGQVVRSKDISSLDPGDEDDDVAGWGGLTGFASDFAEAVRRTVNENDS